MVGRQADVLALSAADRTFLESQVRRHKAPRWPMLIVNCHHCFQSSDNVVQYWELSALTTVRRMERMATLGIGLVTQWSGPSPTLSLF